MWFDGAHGSFGFELVGGVDGGGADELFDGCAFVGVELRVGVAGEV